MADTPQRPGRQEQDAPVAPSSAAARTGLVIQFVKFEMKLLLDGMSDFGLSLLALGALVLGLVRGGADADRPLREVMQLGRRAEHWINLYGSNESTASVDHAVAPLEKKLEEKLTAQLRRTAAQAGRRRDGDPAGGGSPAPTDIAAPPPSPPAAPRAGAVEPPPE